MSIIITVDQAADAAYIQLSTNSVVRTVEVNAEVLVDLDAMDMVVGVELLQVSAEIPFAELIEKYHVHSNKVDLLRLLRPSISTSVLQGGNDGVTSMSSRQVLEAA